MNKSFAVLASLGLVAVGAAALGALTRVPAISEATATQPAVHEALIALATLVTVALGFLALRSFYATGAYHSLALGGALLSFAGIYAWHGFFTSTTPAFAFLIYGPFSRAVFALLLPLLLLTGSQERRYRFLSATGVVAATAGLSAAAWAAQPSLAAWTTSASAATLTTTRLAVEGVAGVAALVSFGLLLWRSPKTPDRFQVTIMLSVLLISIESAFFAATGAWTLAWWAAHGIGALGTLVLTIAVVGELSTAERSLEVVQLRELNAMKTRFINSAAHEIGTPLTPIQLQLSLLRARGDPLTERQQKSLDTIQRNVNRLADLTQSILEGARSQAGRFPVRLEDTDLRTMLDEIASSYTPWCEEKELHFKMVAPEELPMHTDRRRLHQIVSNYVSNAIKNSDRGGSVTLLARQAPGRIRISVEDTGRGLTKAERQRLFQPFSQLDDTAMAVGSGLGLYIARQLAERLGGFVGVDSRGLGEGSTFYVDLPLKAPIDDLRPLPEKALEQPMVIPGAKDT